MKRSLPLSAPPVLAMVLAASAAAGAPPDAYLERRKAMVQEISSPDFGPAVKDPRVLKAMGRVPREAFVPISQQPFAYENRPLPIGLDQTISQPLIVGVMTEALGLSSSAKVLEIGTGSGYQAAVLAEIAKEVYTIEIVPPLGRRAAKTLKSLGYKSVHVRIGDGWKGWPEAAPFDAIMVTAAPEKIPQALIDQLAVGGRLIIPVGAQAPRGQSLKLVVKDAKGTTETNLMGVRFVPMTGSEAP